MSRWSVVPYEALNARQKENYNFQKAAGILADYGYYCVRLSDDWGGADFLAVHVAGGETLKIQLKGRLTFDRKYRGKDIWITFFDQNRECYLYPHDQLLETQTQILNTKSWQETGVYTYPTVPSHLMSILAGYKISGQ